MVLIVGLFDPVAQIRNVRGQLFFIALSRVFQQIFWRVCEQQPLFCNLLSFSHHSSPVYLLIGFVFSYSFSSTWEWKTVGWPANRPVICPRHCAKSGPPRKSCVCASSEVQILTSIY